jgi:hypothetical protein
VGIRESLQQNRKAAVTIAAGVLLVALVAVLLANCTPPGTGGRSEMQTFYSTDDGKSWFPDAADRPSPFEKDGRRAYRVFVWKSADGKQFVSHLERRAAGQTMPAADLEVKKPGTSENAWVKSSSPAAQKVMAPIGPDGRLAVEPVLPK